MTMMAVCVDCVGPRMKALYAALPDDKRGRWCAKAEELAAEAHHLVDAGDVVLVKGSKGSKVSLVVEALRKLGQGRAKGSGQPIEAGHASTDGVLRFSHAGPGCFRLG